MESHFNLSDQAFKKAFEMLTFNPVLFSHEAHVRLAWIYIQEYGVEQAKDIFCKQFMAFVQLHKAENKFNKTLTVASMYIINHFMNISEAKNFRDFIVEHPILISDFKGLMAKHYHIDIYDSEEAKKAFIEPDLIGF